MTLKELFTFLSKNKKIIKSFDIKEYYDKIIIKKKFTNKIKIIENSFVPERLKTIIDDAIEIFYSPSMLALKEIDNKNIIIQTLIFDNAELFGKNEFGNKVTYDYIRVDVTEKFFLDEQFVLYYIENNSNEKVFEKQIFVNIDNTPYSKFGMPYRFIHKEKKCFLEIDLTRPGGMGYIGLEIKDVTNIKIAVVYTTIK